MVTLPMSTESATGIVLNIQHFCTHDGPGIRTTVFLKGCSLRCKWCCNPESIQPKPELAYDLKKCIGEKECGLCLKECPESAISVMPSDGKVRIDWDLCTNCGKCVPVCPPKALYLFGEPMNVDQVLAEVEKDSAFYRESGGGITLSGGECLLQADYSAALLDALRYPWPPAAEHAAEAIAALKLTALSPKVAALLKLPDPARPYSATVNGRQTFVVREVVRLNHMCNCMVCHAPSLNKDDLVRGRAPMPGEDPPPLYYQDRTGQFVRAEVTFLRQDFSVVQPVAAPGKWPGQQRFDYLVRERPLTDPELKAFVRLKDDKTAAEFVQKDAILFTLRELTQRDGGRDYAGWADLLKRMAVEEKK